MPSNGKNTETQIVPKFRYYSFVTTAYSFLLFYFGVALLNDGLNVIIPFVENMHGWTRGQITSVVSIAALISIIASYIVGTLVLRFGVKRLLIPILVMTGITAIVMSRANDFLSFSLCLGILQIFAASGLMLLPAILLANWYVKRKGIAMGIATIGAPLSGATYSLIVAWLIEHYGFDTAYSIVGIIIILIAAIGSLLLVNKPEDVGLSPDGVDKTPEDVEKARKELENLESKWTLNQILSKKESWFYMVSFGLLSLIITGIMSQLIPRFLDVGFSMPQALFCLSLASLLGMPVSFVWGWLDDKISTRITCTIFALTFALGSFCFIFASAQNLVFAILAVVAVASLTGGMPNLEASIVASIFGRNEFVNVQRYLRIGVNVLRSLGYAVMGLIFDKFGSYNISYGIFIVLGIFAAVLIFMARGQYGNAVVAQTN